MLRPLLAALFLLLCHPMLCFAEDELLLEDLFDAIDAKQISVVFIPRDETNANVIIKNLTNKTVNLQLPNSIAAVPVLAQFGQQPGIGNVGVGQNGGAASQGVGGGIQGGGGNPGFGQGPGGGGAGRPPGGNGFNMGFQRIAPEKVRKFKAVTVCLEQGKPSPNPRIEYRLVRLSDFSSDARVAKVCEQLARGELDQKVAQAMAWHFTNGLDWETLSRINRMESKYLGNIPMFEPSEVAAAKQKVEAWSKRATESREVSSVVN